MFTRAVMRSFVVTFVVMWFQAVKRAHKTTHTALLNEKLYLQSLVNDTPVLTAGNGKVSGLLNFTQHSFLIFYGSVVTKDLSPL